MSPTAIPGYELLEPIGEGPQGIVYKARDTRTDGWRAVKIFHSIQTGNFGKLLTLRHGHVARFFEIGHVEARSFTVIEYLPGGSLKSHIQSLQSVGDAFPLDQILIYAEAIGSALIEVHRQGVTHGNLKSENVMFDEQGVLKLVDFRPGVAEESQADVHAFGVLLYELATGASLFPGIPARPIHAFRQDLPDGFARIISRILDSERPDRYRDLHGLLSDLRLTIPQTVLRPGGGAYHAPPAISPGQLLAGRFRIVQSIGRGGMGEVYEAEDLELREHVALKTVRREIATDLTMSRFKREIHLARKVTHPNVCRIFDLFHEGAGAERITFLTMELLKGETLHQRIQRTGRFDLNEALRLIQQMAAGLSAAHKAGVIHRDFKSSNVMLVPNEDSAGSRAVITDFGLARSTLNPESMATLSNEAIGTPAYMAPEQLDGREITFASDIYAFGIVIYEMVTGLLPFAGQSTLAAALQRLQSPPPSPRLHVPDLDDVWESSILRCLEPQPSDRFTDVEDLAKTLTGGTPVASRARAARVPGVRRRFLLVASLVLAAVLVAGLVFRDTFWPSDLRSRRSVAVMGFRNLTGDAESAWLSTALAEMLTTELAAGEKLRAIPGENVARMKVELSLPESSSFAADTLNRIRSYLGADVVVYGSYIVLNGSPSRIRLDLRLQDALQGSLLATISHEGSSSDLLELVSRSGAELRVRLGLAELDPTQAAVAQATLPATPAAARFYAEGLDRLRVFDALRARDSLENAVAEDPRHALARAALATSWSMLGYATKAQEHSRAALDLSKNLAREDQLLVEGRSLETTLEWTRAADVYRTLFGFFPDNLDYGLRLVAALTSAGQGKEAIAVIEKLRNFPAPDGDSPRIDLAEARAAGSLSDFKRQQEMAALAATKAGRNGARLLVAGSRMIEGNAFASMGELSRARTAFEYAREMYIAAGDRWNAANVSTNIAYIVSQSGDPRAARGIYEQSLAIYRQVGDQKGTAAALGSMATVLRDLGDLKQAGDLHEQALAINREIGDRIGEARSLNNLANILSVGGDHSGAREKYEAALTVFREIGDRNALATVLSNLGDLVSEEGDLARARELYEESRVTFQAIGNKSSLAYELSRLGDLDLIGGDLAAAKKTHLEALALRQEIGEEGGVGDSQLALAQIALHQDDPASAEAAARAAADEFRAAARSGDEASAMAVLARSFLVRGKSSESAQALKRAEELAAKSDDIAVRLSVAITGASILAARGDTAKSLADLQRIVAQTSDARLLRLQLEARLALAEAEISTGRVEAGRNRLEALMREASGRGYKYIADRAAAAHRRLLQRALGPQKANRKTIWTSLERIASSGWRYVGSGPSIRLMPPGTFVNV